MESVGLYSLANNYWSLELLYSTGKKKKYLIAWNLVTVINNLYSIFNSFLNNEKSSSPGREQLQNFFWIFFQHSPNWDYFVE